MKKMLSLLAAVGLTATSATSVVACGTNKVKEDSGDKGEPFVLMLKNGKNGNDNSFFRLQGRHQQGYINRNFNDKFGPAYNNWESELGLELDNSNPAVQAEQLNWLYYLLFFNQIRNNDKKTFIAKTKASDSTPNDPDKFAEDNESASTFDGVRVDCGDAVDSDVLGQTSQLLNDLYNRNASDGDSNDHLSYNEGYGPNDQVNEKNYFHNSSLNYDDSYYQNMTSHLMWYNDSDAPRLYNANSFISKNWEDDETENEINPNLTYSQNHDNFNSRLMTIARLQNKGFSYTNFTQATWELLAKSAWEYYAALGRTDKTFDGVQIAPKNQISLYADMLTNKDTVPVIFYGDLFEVQKDYMSTPSPIASPIMDILKARSKYVSGGQQRKVVDAGNIITNVRFGKNYYEGKTKSSDSDYKESRTSGIVTVYSNKNDIDVKGLKVYVGKNHAGQTYTNLLDTDATNSANAKDNLGLTTGDAADTSDDVMGVKYPDKDEYILKHNLGKNHHTVKVDNNGYITLNVKGTDKPFVDGYLSMWVPEGIDPAQNVYVTEGQAKKMHTFEKTGETLNSNAALDSHVLYQSFAVNIPEAGLGLDKDGNTIDIKKSQDKDYYAMLKKNADSISNSGITDVWMAPPYVSPKQTKGQLHDWYERYGYGYMMSDRYNLGEDGTPSKYGTYKQLIDATNALHNTSSMIDGRSIKVTLDFVPHQIIRGDQKEKVTYDEYDAKIFSSPLTLDKKNVTSYLKTATSNSNLQYQYGGKYLPIIDKLFPDIFDTEAPSTGLYLPYDEPIKNWSAKYEVSYPLEFGIDSSANSMPENSAVYEDYVPDKRR